MKMTKQQRMGTALQREAVPKKILISEKSVSMQIRVIWSLPYTMIFKNFWQVPSPKDPEQVRLSWDKSEGPLVSKWMKAWNNGLTLEGDGPIAFRRTCAWGCVIQAVGKQYAKS